MRHDHLIEGAAFRLRPIADDDAAFVVALRNQPALARWIHAGAVDEAAQRRWLAGYYERRNDFYFVVESRDAHRPEGLIALYDIDAAAGTAEWGRWVLRPGSLAAIESAWLMYRFAFDVIGLESVVCRTVADNEAVVSFHDSCGIPGRQRLIAAVELHGQRHDVIEHRLQADEWPIVERKLALLVNLTARRLARAVA